MCGEGVRAEGRERIIESSGLGGRRGRDGWLAER